MAEMVECLPSKGKTLSSNLSSAKKKNVYGGKLVTIYQNVPILTS
jgi:hypothetical protein